MPPRRRAGSGGAASADALLVQQQLEEAASSAPSRSHTEPGQIAHVHYHGAHDWPCALLLLASFAAAALVGHAHEHVHEVSVKAAHPAAPPALGTHFVFVLDESSSMSGARWADLRAAYGSFASSRAASVSKAQAAADAISVVYFSSSARLAQDNAAGYGDVDASNRGGGTSYSAGLSLALAQLRKTAAGRAAHLVFLSDGEDGDSPSERAAAVGAIRAWASGRSEAFEVSTVACGKDTRSVGSLMDIKDGVGAKGATHHAAEDAAELNKVFGHIGDWASYDDVTKNVFWTAFNGSPVVLLPLGVALVFVLSFCILLKYFVSLLITAVLSAVPLIFVALALWAAETHHVLPHEAELAIVGLGSVLVLFICWRVYKMREAAVSLSLGAAALVDMPSLFLLQAALMLPWAMWARFIVVAVTSVEGGYTSLLLRRAQSAFHAFPVTLDGLRACVDAAAAHLRAALTFFTGLLTLTAKPEQLLAAAHSLSGVGLALQLLLVTGTLFALVNIAVSRATAARFFGFSANYALGAISVLAAVTGGALGTAVIAGSIYLVVVLLDGVVKRLTHWRVYYRYVFSAVLPLAILCSYLAASLNAWVGALPESVRWLSPLPWLWHLVVTSFTLGWALDFVWNTLRAFAQTANYLVCVVAGVTGNSFLASGAEALQLVEREPLKIGAAAATAHVITRAAMFVLSVASVAASLKLASYLGIEPTTHQDELVMGSAVAVLFIVIANETIFTATMASLVCMLEQRHADAVSPVIVKRRRSVVEMQATAALGGDEYAAAAAAREAEAERAGAAAALARVAAEARAEAARAAIAAQQKKKAAAAAPLARSASGGY